MIEKRMNEVGSARIAVQIRLTELFCSMNRPVAINLPDRSDRSVGSTIMSLVKLIMKKFSNSIACTAD